MTYSATSPASGISSWQKFKLLTWKNFTLQWRHPIQLAVEIIAPVLFSLLLVLIRSLVDPIQITTPTTYESFTPYGIRPYVAKEYKLTWSPTNTILSEVMNQMVDNIIEVDFTLVDKASSRDLLETLTQPDAMNFTFAGIEFPDSYATLTELPKHVQFSLLFPNEPRFSTGFYELKPPNWRTNKLFSSLNLPGPRAPGMKDGGYPPGYNGEGFLRLQDLLSRTLMEHLGVKNIPTIELQRYPYPEYIDDPLLMAMAGFLASIFMLSFSYTCINTVRAITTEKERQLKEAMKIMGLPSWLHWTAWGLKIFTFAFISIVLCTIALCVKWYPDKDVAVFTYTDPTVILFILFMYIISSIMFCFMLSVFFSKANTAATVSGLLWFVSTFPYLLLQSQYEDLSWGTKMLASLGHNSAMGFSFNLVMYAENIGAGIQWNNIFDQITADDTLTLMDCMLMFAIDSVLFLLIAIYVEQIFPGDFGVPQPWYFPFLKSYWFGVEPNVDLQTNGNVMSRDIYEAEPTNLTAGIQIKKLSKKFGGDKIAVNSLDLNMYEDQITCLLGHNGAGKTTTMSMLTGMIPPTSGTAVISGYDITRNITDVRNSLGLCPQHNILFGDMTVREHLYFFGRLKGVSKASIEDEITKYIKLLELEDKRNALSTQLSGGMQRKLSVGIALSGGSKVVILDEPTSGMDPSARRALWDLLQKEKKGRTVVLTTHFMDEADLLGDRIAILAGGELQCCGSSFFLKKRYGAGYRLIMEKGECDVNNITKLLGEYIPGISVYTDIGSELTYVLPENEVDKFEGMLQTLENQSKAMGIHSFGISLTTLEEVFMKVGHEFDKRTQTTNDSNQTQADNMAKINLTAESYSKSNTSTELHQFACMFTKKFIVTYRSYILCALQVLIPVMSMILTIVLLRVEVTKRSSPELEINIDKYPNAKAWMNPLSDASEDIVSGMELTFNGLKSTLENIGQTNFTESILKLGRQSLAAVNRQHLASLTIEKYRLVAWFNNEAYHAAPIALNLAHNAFLKSQKQDCQITVYNKPLPETEAKKMEQVMQAQDMGFTLAFNIAFSMSLVSSFYILFQVKERITKSKHLQFVSGVNLFIYWFSAYLWDLITFMITVVIMTITIACFNEGGYNTFDELFRLFVSFLMFGVSMLPMMYLASFLFDVPSTGFTRMVLINILTGCAAFLTVEVLLMPGLDLEDLGKTLQWIFIFVPHFSLPSAIRNAYKNFIQLPQCKEQCIGFPFEKCVQVLCSQAQSCCDVTENYWGFSGLGIGRQVVVMGGMAIVFFVILFLNEFGLFKRIYYSLRCRSSSSQLDNEPAKLLDDDVYREQQFVKDLSYSELQKFSLVMRNVSKVYNNKFKAVKGISVAIRSGECFGLLGVNGAGKTTTFKMMTGDEIISEGDIWVHGINVKNDLKNVYKVTGYCPQFDALIDDLTGRETLLIYCNLRGIIGQNAKELSVALAQELDFFQHIDKLVKNYSGGNKRKLSTAIAMISNPSVIYLDEPTTGMDPTTKRNFWNVVCSVRDSGKCVVLTSHSMEECEALCTRLAIMVNGQFQCLGSVQQLKNKFTTGFVLQIKIRSGEPDNIERVKNFVGQRFNKIHLHEAHTELLTFYILDTSLKWSYLFGTMQKIKEELNIEDYSIGQSSLEQVFLSFTREQVNAVPIR